MDYAGMFSLKGRNAIVAGGAGGIGSEVCKALAAHGARVAVADIDEEGGARVAAAVAEYGRAHGAAGADFFPVDVTSPLSVDAMVAAVHDAYGHIDILVCANGIFVVEPSEDVTDVAWDRMMKVNLYGTFYLCRAAGRHMIAQKYGKIVNFSSTDAFLGVPNQASYCSSKGGVNQLTRVLATDWIQHGINVNAVGPCDIDTPMTHKYIESPGYGEWIVNALPIGRVGQPEEIAGAVVYLCSDAARLVVGHTLMVDGGRTVI
jgi:NAD(P)-dependent dehydrogenase (short-subunit alcohol dehydrogenase family)